MRIIHLISNFRWTERVEPAADLVIGQQRIGHDARYLCGKNRGAAPEDCVQGRAAHKGLEFDDRFQLLKHFKLKSGLRDIQGIKHYLEECQPDVVHCHLPNAHLLAALAMKDLSPRPLLVRTIYEQGGPQCPARYWLFCRHRTDGLIVLDERAKERACGRFKRQSGRVEVLLPGIDIEEFSERPELGPLGNISIPENAFVLGMVTAIGKERRIDLALEAVALLADRYPQLQLLICGRGRPQQFIHEPARRLGIESRLLLPGYCRNDDLVRAFRTMDALIYPRHGTDQSCRTVREALASGVPVIAAHTGAAGELVKDGKTGYVTPPTPDALAAGVERLLAMNEEQRHAMSQQAARDAKERFCRIKQAGRTIDFYMRLKNLNNTSMQS